MEFDNFSFPVGRYSFVANRWVFYLLCGVRFQVELFVLCSSLMVAIRLLLIAGFFYLLCGVRFQVGLFGPCSFIVKLLASLPPLDLRI